MELLVFGVFALLAVLSAIVVVSHGNPVYSVMSLVLTLVSLAVLFVLLGAPFLAALLVLVYTGAILVLFLFVLMLLNVGRESAGAESRVMKGVVGVGAVAFAAIVASLSVSLGGVDLAPLTPELVAVKPLARALFSTYLLPFEIVGVLLLAAVIAATVLARRPERPTEGSRS